MKHTGIIITAILTVLIMTGCNSDKREIKQVAYGYVIATGNYNLDEAIPYASKETREATLPIIKENILPSVGIRLRLRQEEYPSDSHHRHHTGPRRHSLGGIHQNRPRRHCVLRHADAPQRVGPLASTHAIE